VFDASFWFVVLYRSSHSSDQKLKCFVVMRVVKFYPNDPVSFSFIDCLELPQPRACDLHYEICVNGSVCVMLESVSLPCHSCLADQSSDSLLLSYIAK